MESEAPEPLLMPSFLYGTYASVQMKAYEEGLRCGAQYRQDGTFPAPLQMREVATGEVVIMDGVVDFQYARLTWRPYLMSRLHEGLWEALDYPASNEVDDRYEEFCRRSAWGALYVASAPFAPRSAKRTAVRLQALLRFWGPLQSAMYLRKNPVDEMTLDELMGDCYGWAMDAWCPVGDAAARVRLGAAAERMARATREESIEAILRQLPRTLPLWRHLKHRALMMDPSIQRQHISMLTESAFERISAACTGELLMMLTIWDRQLGKQ